MKAAWASWRHSVPRPLQWWIALYAGALFLPPIPLGFTPTSRSKLLVGSLVGVAYLMWRPIFSRRGSFDFSTPTSLLPLGLGFYMVFHLVYAALYGNVIGALIEAQWLMYLMAPLLMMWDLGAAHQDRLTKALLACLAIESLFAIISSFTGPMYEYVVLWYAPRFGTNVYRAVGTMDSTNSLGGLMAFGALVCFLSPVKALPARRFLLLMGLLAAVVLSQSKSALFSVLISLAVVSIVSLPWRLMRTPDLLKTVASQAVALGLCAGVFYFYGEAVLANMTKDYGDRTALGQRVITEIAKFDWPQILFGVGFHGVDYVEPSTGAWITAHNSYINLVADLGLCGSALVASLLAVLIAKLLRSRQWHLLAGLLGLLLHFVTEAFLYAPMFIMTLGTLYGLSCGHRRPSAFRLQLSPRSRLSLDPGHRWSAHEQSRRADPGISQSERA